MRGWLDSWVAGTDCCGWAGDNSTGQVIRIHLPGHDGHCDDYSKEASKHRLKGEISPSLLDLKQLRHLDLSCNGIQVPQFIGSLQNLSKAVDWLLVINNLPSLVQLHLSSCNLANIHPYVPSINLTSLSLIDLSYNDFHSSVSKWIFSIISLVSLDLSGCDFHGPVPSSIYSFRNLTSLKLLHVNRNAFMNSSQLNLSS
ncbi:hypothetical protein L1987_48012 [Smallanthus sonchifolius]|uniref:Uncharacterized protein n=1 Tax=Smallanthus sonchifolius TaxID=185202 RepID=A0ACB9FQU0_9ASTR|nr:hypothetical protein L1987_48012 [Smallanthus sonchifolius]